MRDLPQVGGKNASLGEMIGELASAGIRVPGGFATTADAFREFLQQDGLARAHRDANSPRSMSTTFARLPRAGETHSRLDRKRAAAFRRWCERSSAPTRAVDGADEHARSPCARRPPPKTCPMHRSPDSRKHSSISMALSNVLKSDSARYSRRSTTIARSPIACTRALRTPRSRCRSACSAWCAATTARPASCSRSIPNRASRTSCLITSRYGLGEIGRAGRGQSGRVLRVQAAISRRARPAILRKSMGSKATRMVFAAAGAAGESTQRRRCARGGARAAFR